VEKEIDMMKTRYVKSFGRRDGLIAAGDPDAERCVDCENSFDVPLLCREFVDAVGKYEYCSIVRKRMEHSGADKRFCEKFRRKGEAEAEEEPVVVGRGAGAKRGVPILAQIFAFFKCGGSGVHVRALPENKEDTE